MEKPVVSHGSPFHHDGREIYQLFFRLDNYPYARGT
jgi:hypothetical protein